MREKKIIGEVEAGPITKVRVSIKESRSRQYLDIRKYIYDENYSGPTRKGIMLHPETLDDILPFINEGQKILAEDTDEINSG